MELLRQIARQVIISLGFYQAGQIGSELASGTPEMGLAIPGLSGGVGGTGRGVRGWGVSGERRKRRRKALTHDDMRLALTIASAISKKAAEVFILQRVRAA